MNVNECGEEGNGVCGVVRETASKSEEAFENISMSGI